jgi:hypothetical protein
MESIAFIIVSLFAFTFCFSLFTYYLLNCISCLSLTKKKIAATANKTNATNEKTEEMPAMADKT